MPGPNESVWGSINTCFEIGLEIYQLFCKAPNGESKSGLAIPVDRAKDILSEKALSQGTEKDGFIHFESPNQTLAPAFELLKSAAITDESVIKAAGDLDAFEQKGKAGAPEYFGSLPLPQNDISLSNTILTLPGSNRTVNEIRSGLSVIKDAENHFLVAVHKTLAERDMTPTALKFGDKADGFYLYGAISCAVPIYELSRKYPEINDYVQNRESLEQTLVSKAPNYVAEWNAIHDKPGETIKPNDSIPMMFLQEHYDLEADSTRTEVAEYQMAHAHEAAAENDLSDEVLELER